MRTLEVLTNNIL